MRTVLSASGLNADSLNAATSALSDDELASLAAKARRAEIDISGGELSDAHVTLIIMAVADFAFLTVLVITFQ